MKYWEELKEHRKEMMKKLYSPKWLYGFHP